MHRNIPPHTLGANAAQEAFKLREMAPAGVRLESGKLLSAAEKEIELERVKKGGSVHPYVVSRINSCLKTQDGNVSARGITLCSLEEQQQQSTLIKIH